jgi:hypothetical protein
MRHGRRTILVFCLLAILADFKGQVLVAKAGAWTLDGLNDIPELSGPN